MIPRPCSILLGLLLVVLLPRGMSRCRAASAWQPPAGIAEAQAPLGEIDQALKGGDAASAASRLEQLLQSGKIIGQLEPDYLLGISGWMDALPARQRELLKVPWRAIAEPPASAALESLRRRNEGKPVEFYALARRYPLTLAAGAALAEACDRWALGGELWSAITCYELAAREGWSADEPRQRRIAAMKSVVQGSFAALPEEIGRERSPAAGGAKASGIMLHGRLAFEAPWYGAAAAHSGPVIFPELYGGKILLATWKNVTALREDGQVLWRTPNPAGAINPRPDRCETLGPVFAPAVIPDVFGRPAIIVVRQPAVESESRYQLRALSGDGKVLWKSETAGKRSEWSFVSTAAVGGGYVYAISARRQGFAKLELATEALDALSGQSLWTAELGTIETAGQPLDPAALAGLGAPAVCGDLVLLAPNCGAVIALGRFDGSVRWVRGYRSWRAEPENPQQKKQPRDDPLRDRYSGTPAICDGFAVVVPQDSPAVLALNLAEGKILWKADLPQVWGVAGGAQGAVVLGGRELAGVDLASGRSVWRYSPAGGARLTGPAVVAGDAVVVPTSAGMVQLDLSSGRERRQWQVPDLSRLVTSEAGQALVREAGAERAFGPPPK